MRPKPIVVRVGKGGRFNLPKKVQEHLDVKSGDHVCLTLEEGRVVQVQPVEFVIRRMGEAEEKEAQTDDQR